ncbi:chitin disaccharide deacetylase [Urechidicola sp. KH5]
MKKQLIIHADDAGLSHAENLATINGLKNGCITSYSIMAPCAWSYEMAQFAIANTQYDCGVHLTLTCEWNTYKFGPILSKSVVPSLVDENGFFHKKRHLFLERCKIDEVRLECEAQIDYLLNLGVQLTHIDSHMFTLGLSPELLQVYRDLGKKYNLPIFLNKALINHFTPNMSEYILETDFCIDHFIMGDWNDFEKGGLANFYDKSIQYLKPGTSIVLIHPAFDGDEMQGICVDHPNFGAEWRQIDSDFFSSESCKNSIDKNGIQLTNWKQIQSK